MYLAYSSSKKQKIVFSFCMSNLAQTICEEPKESNLLTKCFTGKEAAPMYIQQKKKTVFDKRE